LDSGEPPKLSIPLVIPGLIDGMVLVRSIYRGFLIFAHKRKGAPNLRIHSAGAAIHLETGSTKAAFGKT